MEMLNQNYLLANCLWGAVAGGYMIYGWRQRSLVPFLGGFVMMGVSWFVAQALMMSLASLAIMFAVWWLTKRGF